MSNLLLLLANVDTGGGFGNRVALANNSNIPNNSNNQASWVHNAWTTHKAGPVDYTNIEVTFLNGLIGPNAEGDAGYDFVLRCGIKIGNTFYQGLCGGLTEVTVSKNWGTATFTFPTLVSIPAHTTFIVTNRRVASDGGVAVNYDVITNTGGITQRQDGIIAGTDNTKDFTLGVGVAYGAANNRVTAGQITAGIVTGVTTASGGSGYSGGLNLGPWYGPAGAGAKGASIPGSGISGYGNTGAGQYTTSSILSGGTGHDSANPPYIFVGGASTAASGFGTTTAAYGPSLITGIPSASTPSILLHGDSIMSGYGSVDDTGDLSGNYGVYEQRLANAYGLFKVAVGGESAAGWLANNTRQLAFIDAMIARGLKMTHVIIGLGVNDFLTNNNTDVITAVESYIVAIANIWRARGAKIIITTIPPSDTGIFTTIVGQTPTLVGGSSANYIAGGRVEQYNTAIIGGAVANDGIIDIGAICRDATTTSAWRVDTYGGVTAFTGDGIHPSKEVGIPYCVANLTLPTIAV